MGNERFPILPQMVEFSDYNSRVLMYYTTVSEIESLQKENRKRVKEIRELMKKYFNGAEFSEETIKILKDRGITEWGGFTL